MSVGDPDCPQNVTDHGAWAPDLIVAEAVELKHDEVGDTPTIREYRRMDQDYDPAEGD